MRRFPLLRQAARLFLSHCISAKNLMPLTAPVCRKCAIFWRRRAGAFWRMCRKRPSGSSAAPTCLRWQSGCTCGVCGWTTASRWSRCAPLRSSCPLPSTPPPPPRRWRGSWRQAAARSSPCTTSTPARRPVLTRNFCARAPQLCRQRACRCTALSPATPCCAARCTRVCPRWKPTAPLPPRRPLRTWR